MGMLDQGFQTLDRVKRRRLSIAMDPEVLIYGGSP